MQIAKNRTSIILIAIIIILGLVIILPLTTIDDIDPLVPIQDRTYTWGTAGNDAIITVWYKGTLETGDQYNPYAIKLTIRVEHPESGRIESILAERQEYKASTDTWIARQFVAASSGRYLKYQGDVTPIPLDPFQDDFVLKTSGKKLTRIMVLVAEGPTYPKSYYELYEFTVGDDPAVYGNGDNGDTILEGGAVSISPLVLISLPIIAILKKKRCKNDKTQT